MPGSTLRFGAALAAVIVLAACAEDEPEVMPESEEAYVDAIADIDDAAVGDDELTRCVWASIVNTVGYDRLVEADVTPSELFGSTLSDNDLDIDDAAAADLTATVGGCGDLVGAMLVDIDEDVADCFSAQVSNDIVAEALIEGFRGNDPPAEFEDAAEECAPE